MVDPHAVSVVTDIVFPPEGFSERTFAGVTSIGAVSGAWVESSSSILAMAMGTGTKTPSTLRADNSLPSLFLFASGSFGRCRMTRGAL